MLEFCEGLLLLFLFADSLKLRIQSPMFSEYVTSSQEKRVMLRS